MAFALMLRPRAAAAAVLAVSLAATACAGARGGVEAEGTPLVSRCPVPLAWSTADPRPLGVRIQNDQAQPVLIFLDRCEGHVRVGEVAPGAVRAFRLTPPLVAFPDGFRFHVFPGGGLDGYYLAALPVDTARVLELRIPAESPAPCESRVYVDGEPFAGGLREVGLERIAGMRVEYASSGPSAVSCPVVRITTHGAASARRGWPVSAGTRGGTGARSSPCSGA